MNNQDHSVFTASQLVAQFTQRIESIRTSDGSLGNNICNIKNLLFKNQKGQTGKYLVAAMPYFVQYQL